MAMKREEIKELADRLLAEIGEEDIGISLFLTFYQDENELSFFSLSDRQRIVTILKKLSEDSKQHKLIISKIITGLEEKLHGK